jgi:ABC-type sulfate transport system permease component
MFELLDIGDKNFIMNSGSYFVIIFIMLVYYLLVWILNLLAVHFKKSKTWREIGIWLYEKSFVHSFKQACFKLFIESYFDLAMCAAMGFLSFIEVSMN